MEETWKSIKGYEGYYEISDKGRVKSLTRKVMFGERVKFTKETILKEINNGRDYMYVTLSCNNKKTKKYIHRLVAGEFLPNEFNKPEVNHKNGIKKDNNISNLEWVTSSENQKHAFETGLTVISILKLVEIHKGNEYSSQRTKVFDKEKGKTYEFVSSKKASLYFGFSRTYFSEIIKKSNGENQRFKAEYIGSQNKKLLEEK